MDCITIKISNKIYDKNAIIQAKNQFGSFAKVSITPLNRSEIEVNFQIKKSFSGQCREIINEFLNYSLDLSIKNKEES